ncbi:MAG TPA: 50S ribosomal protein L33 [Acidobacteriota bacterium]|nr:50S ribosomal protein L33 [Acidobacteriota bacterium]
MPREKIVLACVECKRRNYTVSKNRSLKPDRVSYRKYCAYCHRHTMHKETR